MNQLRLIFLTSFCALAAAATAQDTNYLRTQIGVFENRTGVVIVKGFGQIGSVAVGAADISVRCKETTDISIGQKLYGLAVQISGNGFQPERIYVDEDEIDPLLSGLNYLLKVSYDVTALPSFEASYTTKAGLQMVANSVRKDGGVRFSLQGNYSPPIPLSSMQVSQLYTLITEARKNLDTIKAGK
jgi:hypothetical protein